MKTLVDEAMRGRWWIVAVAAVLCMNGCRRDAPRESSEGEEVDGGEREAVDGAPRDESADDRSAFGLPFPPKVDRVARDDDGVKVTTRMELDQIEKFFETRLTDFEILRPASNKIRVVGLYEFMPAIRGHQFGPMSVLFYRENRKEPEGPKAGAESSETDAGGSGRAAEASSGPQRRPGTPVQLKTDDGEPLAPGAEWGEPYTPPPGTPLHKPRYRANWGKPIGEWQLP